MASLPGRQTASFQAIQPIPSAAPLDGEFNALVGATGIFNGGTTGTKLLVKTSDAADPPIAVDQIGAGPIFVGKQNGVTKITVENDGDLIVNGITGAAGIYTFGNIPVGPTSNPTTDDQLTRKRFVDDKAIFFSLTFKIDDPSTATQSSTTIAPVVRVPAIASGFLTRIHVLFNSGTHTNGTGLSFAVLKNFVSVATVGLTDTNNTVNTFYTTDFADSAIADGDSISITFTRSGTVTERDVSIIVEGYQKVKSV